MSPARFEAASRELIDKVKPVVGKIHLNTRQV
jgi:hypothetical protein